MHRLNKKTQDSLYRKIGLTYDQMQKMDVEEIDAFIEKRIGKKLTPAITMKNLVNRGSVYLFFNRMLPMSVVDRRLAEI